MGTAVGTTTCRLPAALAARGVEELVISLAGSTPWGRPSRTGDIGQGISHCQHGLVVTAPGLVHDKPFHDTMKCPLQTSCRNTGYSCFRIAPVVGLRCRFSSKAHCSCDRSTDGVRSLCWLPCRAGHRLVEVRTESTINGARHVRP